MIRVGGAGAAGLTLLGAATRTARPSRQGGPRKPAPAGAMNVVVVMMDSLRADHVYGRRARTPAWDKVPGESLRFTRAYPEAMPTIPARRSLMSGKRIFPYRGWHPYDGLPPQPGWEPVGSDGKMWTEVLREKGWTTGYVTDNPHILLPVHKRFRKRLDRVELVDGQVPLRRKPTGTVSQETLYKYVPPSLRGSRHEPRMEAYLAANPRDRPEEQFLSPRVFTRGDGLGRVGARPPAVRARRRLVRRPRALGRPEAAQRPVRLAGRERRRADPAVPDAGAKYRRSACRGSLLHRMRELYAAEVTMVDTWLGHFLDRLASLGLLDNTLVVLVSDHGVLLGEYGWVGKRYTEVHTELSHVPFAIRHPAGKAKGRTSRYWASHHDIGPTVLSVLGQEPPERMNGADLSPAAVGQAAGARGAATAPRPTAPTWPRATTAGC